MFIEFQLPTGAGGQAAAHALMLIRRALVDWTIKYNIPYTEKTVKYTHRVCFNDDKDYNFFALTWNPDSKYQALSRFRIITDRNNRQD